MKQVKAWAGLVNDKVDVIEIDDGWGSYGQDGFRRSPALFTSQKMARKRYQRVVPILITPLEDSEEEHERAELARLKAKYEDSQHGKE